MTGPTRTRVRWTITVLVALAELGHLAWEHFHGGMVSHHLLNRADLPAISNAWGAVFLPALAWFLSGPVLRRAKTRRAAKGIAAAFLGSLLVGVALSVAFTHGMEDVSSWIFLGMLLAGLFLPVYRAEYVLGFVLGMTFTFGAILPTAAAAFVAIVSAIAHHLVRPALGWLWAKARA
jgi:hypothetical protein